MWTKLRIGSDPVRCQSEGGLLLPRDRGIQGDHALIVETKKAPFFVLVDRSQGRTRVNGSTIGRIKVLRHGDEIELGDTEDPIVGACQRV